MPGKDGNFPKWSVRIGSGKERKSLLDNQFAILYQNSARLIRINAGPLKRSFHPSLFIKKFGKTDLPFSLAPPVRSLLN